MKTPEQMAKEIKITKKQLKQIKRFMWNRVKVKPTRDRMTDAAGLGGIITAFDQSPLSKEFSHCLPERSGHRTKGSYRVDRDYGH
jgi:hypothetical protein